MKRQAEEERTPGCSEVTTYYDQTRRDYKHFWHTGKHLSMHFGYSDSGTYRHDQAVVRMTRELATRAGIARGELVADLGCGLGGSSLWLAENIGCRVVGIDMNPRSLALATNGAERRGLRHLVSFRQADFPRLPFDSGSIDVAWFLESFCQAPDKYDTLREVHRVLRPAGRLVIADWLRMGDGEELDAWLRGWAIPGLPTAQEFHSWMSRLGFTKINIEDITARVMDSMRMLHRRAAILYPVGKVLEKLRLRTPVETGNIVAAINIYRSLVNRQSLYHITTGRKESEVQRGEAPLAELTTGPRVMSPSKKLAGEPGFEPGLRDPESRVLPLDDSPAVPPNAAGIGQKIRLWHPKVPNPMPLVRPPRLPPKAMRTFTSEEIFALFSLRLSPQDRALLTLLVDIGPRAQECANLTRGDVVPGYVTLRGKTGERVVPISGTTYRLLDALRPKGADSRQHVFMGKRGPLTYEGIYKVVRRMCRDAGIIGARASPHTFRHTFGTNYAASPACDPKVLQDIMGHRDFKTTLRYIQNNPRRMARNHRRCSPLREVTAAAQGALLREDVVTQAEAIVASRRGTNG